MTEVITSIGLLILYVSYTKLTTHFLYVKIKNNEQRLAELSKQIRELKEDIYINKQRSKTNEKLLL